LPVVVAFLTAPRERGHNSGAWIDGSYAVVVGIGDEQLVANPR
jgi:hypothetical protein